MKQQGNEFSWHVYDLDINRAYHSMKDLVGQGEYSFKRHLALTASEYLSNMWLTVSVHCDFRGIDSAQFIDNRNAPLISNAQSSGYDFHLAYCLCSFDFHRIGFLLDYQKSKVGKADFVNRVEFLVYEIVRLNCAFRLDDRLSRIVDWISKERIATNESVRKPRISFDDIINQIYRKGLEIGRDPDLHHGHHEPALRSLLVYGVDGLFDNHTVTKEALNMFGKTDILIRHLDGSNACVGECKIWRSPSELLKALGQLIDRYLSWHDSKAVLIFFVRNKNFSRVLDQIRKTVTKHSNFIRKESERFDSSFSYVFHIPNNKKRHVTLEIMAFHFPRSKKVTQPKNNKRSKRKNKVRK